MGCLQLREGMGLAICTRGDRGGRGFSHHLLSLKIGQERRIQETSAACMPLSKQLSFFHTFAAL